jgi:hypothetical protein
MKSAALEFGTHGITVNAFVPGLIDTPLTRHKERYAQALQTAGKTSTGSSTDEEEARKVLTVKTPLGVPWIEPEDVALVVVFLASDAARMVSGATYDVTGGDSANNTAYLRPRRASGASHCQPLTTNRLKTSVAWASGCRQHKSPQGCKRNGPPAAR